MQKRIEARTRLAKAAFLGVLVMGTIAVAQPARIPRPFSLATVPGATPAIRAAGSDDDTVVTAMIDALLTGQPIIPFDSDVVRRNEAGRLRFVRSFAPVLKAIVGSQIFADIYTQQRQRRIDAQLPALPQTYDEFRAAPVAQLPTASTAAEAASRDRATPAAARTAARRQATELKNQRRALQRGDGDPAVRATMTAARTQAEAARAARLPALEAQLPADVKVLVARRLREFLTLSEDIDFDARLETNAAGRQIFRSDRLQAKPAAWKLCFRAGEDTVEFAREFATEWLRSLPAAR